MSSVNFTTGTLIWQSQGGTLLLGKEEDFKRNSERRQRKGGGTSPTEVKKHTNGKFLFKIPSLF